MQPVNSALCRHEYSLLLVTAAKETNMNTEVMIPVEELQFVEWTARIGHVSFLDKLCER